MAHKYLNKWFDLNLGGIFRRAKVVDIEFEGGLGPLFLMKPNKGEKFWLTNKELKHHRM